MGTANIPPEEQPKVQALMSNPEAQDRDILSEIMDAMSDEAQQRGLTPEILEGILGEGLLAFD